MYEISEKIDIIQCYIKRFIIGLVKYDMQQFFEKPFCVRIF